MHKMLIGAMMKAKTEQAYIAKMDLKDAYVCVEVPTQYRKYLGIHIDDILVVNKKETMNEELRRVTEVITKAGFKINKEKSDVEAPDTTEAEGMLITC